MCVCVCVRVCVCVCVREREREGGRGRERGREGEREREERERVYGFFSGRTFTQGLKIIGEKHAGNLGVGESIAQKSCALVLCA